MQGWMGEAERLFVSNLTFCEFVWVVGWISTGRLPPSLKVPASLLLLSAE